MTIQDSLPFGRYRLTVDDYERLAAAGAFAEYPRTELIDGVVYTMSPQYRPHWYLKNEITYRLRRTMEAECLGFYVGSEGSVLVSGSDQPEPDIIVTDDPNGDGAIPSASVKLIVEIASTTLADDLGEKANVYAAAGIPEYWVADVEARILHQLWSPLGGKFAEHRTVAFGSKVEAVTIPGVAFDLPNI